MSLFLEVSVVDPEVATIACYGQIVAGDEAFELRAELRSLLDQHAHLIVDLEHVEKMDCAGLGSIANAAAQAIASRRRLEVRGSHGVTEKMLELARLNDAVGLTDPELSEAAQIPYAGPFADWTPNDRAQSA